MNCGLFIFFIQGAGTLHLEACTFLTVEVLNAKILYKITSGLDETSVTLIFSVVYCCELTVFRFSALLISHIIHHHHFFCVKHTANTTTFDLTLYDAQRRKTQV